MEAGTIYIATNKTNGKIYVGQTRRSFAKRHKRHIRGQHLFCKACRKYGIDGFTWQQILYHKDELNYWEQYFIEKLNSMHPNGYNLNGARSELHKANISKALMGHDVSEEVRQAVSIAKTGSKDSPETIEKKRLGSIGHIVSQEACDRMSKARLNVPRKEEHKRAMRKPKGEVGKANIIASNRDPVLIAKRAASRKRNVKLAQENNVVSFPTTIIRPRFNRPMSTPNQQLTAFGGM